MLLLVVTTPIYLRVLGTDRFGLYMLLVAVVAPFQVLNAGVSQATVKHLSAWIPASRFNESAAMMRIGLLFNWVAGLVAVCGLWVAAPWLANSVFQIAPALREDAIVSFRMAGPLWLVIQITGSLGSVVTAEQNFRLISITQMARAALTYLGGIPVLYMYGTVASLQTWSIITYFPVLALWGYNVGSVLGLRALLPGFDRRAFRRSFRFSFWQMLNALASTISLQVDRVLLGAMLGTAAVGAYGIAASIQQRTITLVWSAFATLFPAISKNSRSNPERAEADVLEQGAILSLLASCAYTAGFWFSGPFCILWLGADQNTETVSYLLRWLFLIAILAIPSAQMMQYLLGHGLTRLIFLGNVGMALITAALSFVFISHFGVKGAVIGALAGLLVSRLPMHIWVVLMNMRSGTSAISRLWKIYGIPTIFFGTLAAIWFGSKIMFLNFKSDGLNIISISTLFFLSLGISLTLTYFFSAKSTFHEVGKHIQLSLQTLLKL